MSPKQESEIPFSFLSLYLSSLPIPSREAIQAASPSNNSASQSMLGASSGLVQGGTATETASGQLSDAQMMEDPSEAFEREILAK